MQEQTDKPLDKVAALIRRFLQSDAIPDIEKRIVEKERILVEVKALNESLDGKKENNNEWRIN